MTSHSDPKTMNTFGFVILGLLLFFSLLGWALSAWLDLATRKEQEERHKQQLYGHWRKYNSRAIEKSDVSVTPKGRLSRSLTE